MAAAAVSDSGVKKGNGNGKDKGNWYGRGPPQNVLIIKKPDSARCTKALLQIAEYLISQKKMDVFVESIVHKNIPHLKSWRAEEQRSAEGIHFIIAIGGDGTMLHINSLFPVEVPPVLAYNFGSLGFLTPFPPEEYESAIDRVLAADCDLFYRRRLECHIVKAKMQGKLEDVAVNEVVISRGVSPMCTLDVMMNGINIATIEADGVIIATATGSTAYSLSAGGTVVHPSIPVMLLTPICSHSLTSRPVILPEDVELTIRIPHESRAGAVVSVDGRCDIPIEKGDHVKIFASEHPVPCFSQKSGLEDWFSSLSHCLSWNSTTRAKKKPESFDEVTSSL